MITALEPHKRHIQLEIQHLTVQQIYWRPAVHPINPQIRTWPWAARVAGHAAGGPATTVIRRRGREHGRGRRHGV